MLTTTEAMSAMLERVMDDLYVRCIREPEGEFLFSRDASTIVATAVGFFGDEVLKAFTRGGFCLSNDFDVVAGRACAVENFAFGGAKSYLEHFEHFEAHAFIFDHVRWPPLAGCARLQGAPQVRQVHRPPRHAGGGLRGAPRVPRPA